MKEHDIVKLNIDLPLYNLTKGDKGTIIHVYNKDRFEVEFLKEGYTCMLPLRKEEVR